MLEWVAISSSRESSRLFSNPVSCVSSIGRQIPYHFATWEVLNPPPKWTTIKETQALQNQWNGRNKSLAGFYRSSHLGPAPAEARLEIRVTVHAQSLHLCPTLCDLLWAVALQAPLSMGFSRQEYWSWLLCPPPGIFLTQGWNLSLLRCRWILYPLSHLGSHKGYSSGDLLGKSMGE